MPFTAGTSGMPYRAFLPYDVLSAGMWSATFCVLGFIFYRSFTQITNVAGKGSLALAILIGVSLAVYQVVKRLRHPEDRERLAAWVSRQAQRPALRPLAAVARALWATVLRPLWRLVLRPIWIVTAPPLRFVGARLTPGELGIELTTLLAVTAVSVYTVVLQVNLIEPGGSLITGDRWALELARDIQTHTLTTIAKVLSFLGSFWVVLLAVIATSFFLVTRERLAEAATLAIGFVLTDISVHVMKAAVDRPRPPDPLVDSGGSAYPSGHAALAVTYLAIAVLLAHGGRAARRLGIVLAGVAAVVLIGLSRVYLRVHWLSDVGGGWAVGLALFSACGCIALVVQYLRSGVGGTTAADAPR
jgi:undecaprenyl-diphosphatase